MVRKSIKCSKADAYSTWEQWKKDNKDTYKSLLSECSTCGQLEQLHIHHLDGDKRNNDISNLQPLCVGCHLKEHRFLQVTYLLPDDEPVPEAIPEPEPIKSPDEKIKDYVWAPKLGGWVTKAVYKRLTK